MVGTYQGETIIKRNFLESRLCVIATMGLFVQPGSVMAAVSTVDCTVGGILQTAIDSAAPGDTIKIKGNCAEDVFIGIDSLTLTNDTVATEGVDGSVSLLGARRVTLRLMTVKNNNGNGVSVFDGGSLLLDDVTISGHLRIGLSVFENSNVRIFGGTITDNGRQGFALSGSSRANISGGTAITDNSREGVAVSFGSSIFIGSSSSITDNGRDGLRVTGNSNGSIDDITISGNGRRAIQLFDSGFLNATDSLIESDVLDSASFPGGILVNRGSNLGLGGGNTVSNTAAGPGGGTANAVVNG